MEKSTSILKCKDECQALPLGGANRNSTDGGKIGWRMVLLKRKGLEGPGGQHSTHMDSVSWQQ